MPSQPPKNNQFIKFSSLGFQMAITIGLGAWGGNYLDTKYQNEQPIYTIILILLSIGIALYMVIKEVIKLTKEDEKKEKNEN